MDSIWVQCVDGGGLIYVNTLADSYRVYFLGDGKFVELVGDVSVIDELPRKNKFIITLSSPDAEPVKVSMGFEGSALEALFKPIWSAVD